MLKKRGVVVLGGCDGGTGVLLTAGNAKEARRSRAGGVAVVLEPSGSPAQQLLLGPTAGLLADPVGPPMGDRGLLERLHGLPGHGQTAPGSLCGHA